MKTIKAIATALGAMTIVTLLIVAPLQLFVGTMVFLLIMEEKETK